VRVTRFVLSFVFTTVLLFPSAAQQAAGPKAQAAALLQSASAALCGGQNLTDVTLSGTARRIAGSDDETGAATLKALAIGASRIDLSLPSGQYSEIKNTSGNPTTGSWSGPNGISYAIAVHNLVTEPAWFFPDFTVARGLLGSTYSATYVGHETWNSTAVEHVVIYQQSAASSSIPGIVQHLSQQDLYLDSSTFLPVAMTFNVHPDNITTEDIPLTIGFSDYRVVNGAQVPFHVQKYMNNGLILDLQFQSAALNTGLSTSSFTPQ
jgi:hypothetical protein